MMSQKEKDRIREEMEYRELIKNELTSDKTKRGGKRDILVVLDHPFIVTVLGGLMIAAAGWFFQYNYTNQQQNLNNRKQFQDQQYKLLTSFSEPLNRYMLILYNCRQKQYDLKHLARGERDFLGRDREEIEKLYAVLAKELIQSPSGEAVLVSIRALFCTKRVIDAVNKLDKQILMFQENKDLSKNKIKNLGNEVQHNIRSLAAAMRQEIENKESKCGTTN